MLARANRVTRPDDFRTAVRRGRRVSTPHAMLHIVDRGVPDPARFGFIVAKSVGGSVVRNSVRRRLRAVCRDILPSIPLGKDVVIRALPGSETADWTTLHTEIAAGIDKGVKRG